MGKWSTYRKRGSNNGAFATAPPEFSVWWGIGEGDTFWELDWLERADPPWPKLELALSDSSTFTGIVSSDTKDAGSSDSEETDVPITGPAYGRARWKDAGGAPQSDWSSVQERTP